MKLFPNYTPPIAPQSSNANSANFSTLSSNVSNHHYHQITYQTQTLAPLRISQEHFSSKTNTFVGPAGGSGLPNGRQKYQTHHHHHQHQQQHQQQEQLSHDELSDHERNDDDDVLDDNEDDSNSATTSPPPTPSSPTPPELPIRNGLVANYNVNTLNHINNNTVVASGGLKIPATPAATVSTVDRPVVSTGGRRSLRHYH